MSDKLHIDLHMHSTVSDGTNTPVEILKIVREAGIDLFSLTDHDAFLGCKDILEHLGPSDPAFITGVEFSCRDDKGKYHILGYGYDPDSRPIREMIEKGHGFRMKKTKARLDFIAEAYGFTFTDDEVRDLLSLNNPGKPHIANLMVKHGYAKNKEQAIDEYIDQKHFGSSYIKPQEAIQSILESGGIPVLAHPWYGSGNELIIGEDMNERLEYLMGFGIQGVEAFYSGFAPRLQRNMLNLAERYDLFVTAGSDYHGSNKLIEIGENHLDEAEEWPDGLIRFIETVNKHNYRS